MFTCCRETTNSSIIFDGLPSCNQHQHPVQFICKEANCITQSLICSECLPHHRTHHWQALTSFLTPQVLEMLKTGDSQTVRKIQKAAGNITQLFINFKQRITDRICETQSLMSTKLTQILQRNKITMQGGQKITQQSMCQLLLAKQKERQIEWIQSMNSFLQTAIQQSQTTITNIFEDLENMMGTEWEERTHLQNQVALKQYRQHLHPHIIVDPNYFKFNSSLKHTNITINEDQLSITYHKNMPTRPVAIVSNPITADHNKFTFQIVKLDRTALFFAATTVFIGVCNSHIVRTMGMRRINQVGKGAYLIGSSGWSYHHKDPEYDRKDRVGWGFSQGEKIEIVVSVQQPGEITFSKQGKIFKYKFNMPLGLTKRQILDLKPCVSFDADVGAIVKIIN